jgi:adenine-specific DNA-methyltransferase
MPRKKAAAERPSSDSVSAYTHTAKRKNIPPAGLESEGRLEEAPKLRHDYNPHLPPVLRFSDKPAETDELPELVRKAATGKPLAPEEVKQLADALRRHEPWLEWTGKREKPWFEVEPVALHLHERVSTQAILRVLAREDVQRQLFADPQQDYAKAVQFYQHDVDWANRMILGDSLAVMASLARREDLAGKVQTIYFDPPYGIKFASNFQPSLGQRDVKDKAQDLTREPEMVRAYRDTWTLGIHSYLAYIRDRLTMAKELLTDRGSIFVQISDENLHRVRCVMDEVFGAENRVVTVVVKKKGNQKGGTLEPINDYLLWYARDRPKMKLRPMFLTKLSVDSIPDDYDRLEFSTGELRVPGDEDEEHLAELLSDGVELVYSDQLTSGGEFRTQLYPIVFEGNEFRPAPNNCWKHNEDDMKRVARAERILRGKKQIRFKKRLSDFGCVSLTNLWDDVAGAKDKIYVVQTSSKVIERCILMSTEPGDLVLDPTCGSGTAAFVAEQWGRRWITIDTSRVALALARQRLMTARFSAYRLREISAEDQQRNPNGHWIAEVGEDGKPTGRRLTFQCKTVPHITLKSIARNTSLDPIFAKHDPILADKLAALNKALAKHATAALRERLAEKLRQKEREHGKKAVTEADRRRWSLPKTDWREWEVPFDTDPDWPKPLAEALTAYRTAWRAKMDEVNAAIQANAEQEELVDKPEPVPDVVRVSGPFTIEGVIAVEDSGDTLIGGAPTGELETFGSDGRAVANAEAHLDKVIRLLKAAGVDFAGGKRMTFARLAPMTGANLLHAEGEWINGDKKERRVAVSVGPEVGNLSSWQVEQVVRVANRKGYDDVVFAAFAFDAAAQDAIGQAAHPSLRTHMALIRPDIAMDDLLKTQPGSQIFTVFTAPRVAKPEKTKDGQWTVTIEGMDIYDPVAGTLDVCNRDRIASWFLDTDYDGRTFCICQAFFPDKSKWAKLAKALGDVGAVEEERFEALSGHTSLPFPRPARELKKGEPWRVAIKVIDPRGQEGLRVVEMPAS